MREKIRNCVKDNQIFVIFLIVVVCLMMAYEFLMCSKFIDYVDGEYYYSYLPEYFLRHNFHYFQKYPIGTAVCEAPFFFMAHLVTRITQYDVADGYTGIYHRAIGVCGVFYYVVGSSFLYATMKKLFTKNIAMFLQVVIILATPLSLYATKYAAFSHIYTYAISAMVIYVVLQIEENNKDKFSYHLLLGCLVGWLTIIRNINCFLVLFYLLYKMGKGYKERMKKVFSPRRLLPNFLGGALFVVPQMILWKLSTGHFILYSYSGETFAYAKNPKLWEMFFSDAKGLLMFTPILLFTFLGIPLMSRKLTASVVAIFAIEIYTTAAWWCWWLGGVYSIRSFLDIMCFMAIPMAAFVAWLIDRAKSQSKMGQIYTCVFFGVVLILCCYVNIALLKGMQEGVINETLSNWWELKESLRNGLVFH